MVITSMIIFLSLIAIKLKKKDIYISQQFKYLNFNQSEEGSFSVLYSYLPLQFKQQAEEKYYNLETKM